MRSQCNVSAQKEEFDIWGHSGQTATRYVSEICDILKRILGRWFHFRLVIRISELAGHFNLFIISLISIYSFPPFIHFNTFSLLMARSL